MLRGFLVRRHCPHDHAQTWIWWADDGRPMSRTACPDCDFTFDGCLYSHPWSDEELARRGVIDGRPPDVA